MNTVPTIKQNSIWVNKALNRAKEIKEATEKALAEKNKKELEAKKKRTVIYNSLYKELKEFERIPLKAGSIIEVRNPLATLYEIEVWETNPLSEKKLIDFLFVNLDYKIISKVKSPCIEYLNIEEYMNCFIEAVAPLLRV